MFPEGKFQNLMKVGSNDAYGSQTLKFQRAAKSAMSAGAVAIFLFWPHLGGKRTSYVFTFNFKFEVKNHLK